MADAELSAAVAAVAQAVSALHGDFRQHRGEFTASMKASDEKHAVASDRISELNAKVNSNADKASAAMKEHESETKAAAVQGSTGLMGWITIVVSVGALGLTALATFRTPDVQYVNVPTPVVEKHHGRGQR